jgi:hypothetical protein
MRRALGLAALAVVSACAPSADAGRVARSTLVIGIDVSGSFQNKGRYESSIDFAANYLYGHIHGLGGLKQPTNVFVGSLGGEKPGEAKSFPAYPHLSEHDGAADRCVPEGRNTRRVTHSRTSIRSSSASPRW